MEHSEIREGKLKMSQTFFAASPQIEAQCRPIRARGKLFPNSSLRAGAIFCCCLLLGLMSLPAHAQNTPWAQKMFLGVNSHDFGTVPHGAKLKHRLVIKNIWAVPLEITEIRSTCGCVEATANSKILQPKEQGFIDVTMDTSRFTGPKSVNLLVTVGPKFVSTAAVQITAVIRGDVVFNPGGINFGLVQAGPDQARSLDVEYAGTLDWRILEIVKSKSAPFSVTAREMFRQKGGLILKNGKVGYRLEVELDPKAPPGFFRQELLLKTNDPASPTLTVYVEGNVQAGLSVTPETVKFDPIKVGAKATQKVVVVGQQPFRIVRVDGAGGGVQVDCPDELNTNHVIVVNLQTTQAGDINRKLILHTEQGETLNIPVLGKVEP
jgi:hypothetical protein